LRKPATGRTTAAQGEHPHDGVKTLRKLFWKISQIVASLAMAAALILAYVALPADTRARFGLPEMPFSEDVAWYWASMRDTREVYSWFLQRWPSESNEVRVRRRIEDSTWSRVSQADRYEDYIDYLEAYPAGAYASIARSRLEERLWQRISMIRLDASFRAYLDDYPNGPHAREAKEALQAKQSQPPR
jgi:hypothetical protein